MESISDRCDPCIPKQINQSLADLCLELESMGLEPLATSKTSCDSAWEICEALLSSAWMLVNLVHGRAMGFNEDYKKVTENDAKLRSDYQLLESNKEQLEREIRVKDHTIFKGKEIIRRLEVKVEEQSKKLQKEYLKSSQLMSKIEKSEKNFKHEIQKQQNEMEQLRIVIRDKLGIGQRLHPVNVVRLSSDLESVSPELSCLQQATTNRLELVNHTLVGENLMLRDALQMIHGDIQLILASKEIEDDGGKTSLHSLPHNIFSLPLSYGMQKLQEVRQKQISKLHTILKCALS